MVTTRRHFKYGTLLLRLVILVVITIMMLSFAKSKLIKTVGKAEYPLASQRYAQLTEERGELLALNALFSGKRMPPESNENQIGNKVYKTNVPEYASVKLKSPIGAPGSEQPETELIEIDEPMFTGKLLKIKDPSRVYIGVAGPLGLPTSYGRQISEMAEENGAIAAVNASGFVDPDGTSNGGIPIGLVISKGELCYGDLWSYYEVIGFDKEGKLHCEWLTGQQAPDMGIRDAACFGPILVKDGVKQNMNGRLGGYNPRTVIGQAEDGTVMILLIEGRMFTSIGLTYPQLVDYCYDLGMVNAGNMDGGASSVMYYQGEQNTIVSTLYGARALPNCWLVAPES